MAYGLPYVSCSPASRNVAGNLRAATDRCGLGQDATASNGVVSPPASHRVAGNGEALTGRPSILQRIACEPRTDLFCYHWVVKAEHENERMALAQLAAARAMPEGPESAAAVAEAEAAIEASHDNRKVAFGHLVLGALGPMMTAAVFGILTSLVIASWRKAREQAARIKELEAS